MLTDLCTAAYEPEAAAPALDDRFSALRGTYRVTYRIDDKDRVVTVVDVAHRRDVNRT
jgi:mRNA interferase RelE/StbE